MVVNELFSSQQQRGFSATDPARILATDVNWCDAYTSKFFQNFCVEAFAGPKNAEYGVISVSTRNMSAISVAIFGRYWAAASTGRADSQQLKTDDDHEACGRGRICSYDPLRWSLRPALWGVWSPVCSIPALFDCPSRLAVNSSRLSDALKWEKHGLLHFYWEIGFTQTVLD